MPTCINILSVSVNLTVLSSRSEHMLSVGSQLPKNQKMKAYNLYKNH